MSILITCLPARRTRAAFLGRCILLALLIKIDVSYLSFLSFMVFPPPTINFIHSNLLPLTFDKCKKLSDCRHDAARAKRVDLAECLRHSFGDGGIKAAIWGGALAARHASCWLSVGPKPSLMFQAAAFNCLGQWRPNISFLFVL
jgi:hypothetical protein